MTNEELINTAKEAMRNDTMLNKGIVELLCNALVKTTEQRDAVVAEAVQMRQIIDSITNLDNEPQYHEQGMGCGLEDRRITDRYDAMRHGWDEAMERVYAEVIPCAEELSFPDTDTAIAALRAEGVDSAVGRIMVMMNHQNDVVSKVINILQMHASELRSNSVSAQQDRQLRESKGANHESDI